MKIKQEKPTGEIIGVAQERIEIGQVVSIDKKTKLVRLTKDTDINTLISFLDN